MQKKPTLLFVVAAALLNERGDILVQKRPEGKPMAGLWEFPGGKIEQHETPENALARELREELGIETTSVDFEPITFASEPLESRSLVLLLYRCRTWLGRPESQESAEVQWVSLPQLKKLEMPPADGPLVDRLLELE